MLAILAGAVSAPAHAQSGQAVTQDDVFSCVLVNYWLYKFSVEASEVGADAYIREKCDHQLGQNVDAAYVGEFVQSIEHDSPEQFEAKIGPRNREIMARVLPPLMSAIKRVDGKIEEVTRLR